MRAHVTISDLIRDFVTWLCARSIATERWPVLFLDNLRKSSFVKSSGTYGPESVVGEVTVCLHQCTLFSARNRLYIRSSPQL